MITDLSQVCICPTPASFGTPSSCGVLCSRNTFKYWAAEKSHQCHHVTLQHVVVALHSVSLSSLSLCVCTYVCACVGRRQEAHSIAYVVYGTTCVSLKARRSSSSITLCIYAASRALFFCFCSLFFPFSFGSRAQRLCAGGVFFFLL